MRMFVLCWALAVLGGLGACSGTRYSEYEQAAVDEEQGAYRQVEKGAALSPEEQHRLARAKVEPTKMVQHNPYVKNARDVKLAENTHSRVVEMEREIDGVKKDFKGLKNSIAHADIALASSAIAPASGAGAHVKGLRTGEHPGKTRLVFDLDAPGDFKYELDNAQSVLIVRLPGAQWDAPGEKVFEGSKVFQAYAAKPAQDGGALVALRLKGPAKVVASSKLGKNEAGDYRIFIDVAPL
ncbi:MAG: hypothetical protein R3E13_05620 [Alphaproteobacteria bacterium]